MLVVETIAKIRRLSLVHGKSIKEMCRELGSLGKWFARYCARTRRSSVTSANIGRCRRLVPGRLIWMAFSRPTTARRPERCYIRADPSLFLTSSLMPPPLPSHPPPSPRQRDPAPSVTIITPDALRLAHEPQADCARYDSLRRAS